MPTQISGSTGVSKVQDGVVVTADVVDLAVTPEKLSQKMTLMQSVDVTTLSDKTKCDFTGIPSWAKRITVMFSGISTNGTSYLIIQVGTGGVPATSGYTSQASQLYTAAAIASSTAGFFINSNGAAVSLNGAMTIHNINGNAWVETSCFGSTAGASIMSVGSGAITLAGTLNIIRITTVNGTDIFDAGTINVLYEG